MDKWTRANYNPPTGLGRGGARITGSPEHVALSRRAAGEGMVLLKNEDQTLPLKPGSNVALFGKATIDYVKGGGGSGDVTVSHVTNLADGLREYEDQGLVHVFRPLVDFYKNDVEDQYHARGNYVRDKDSGDLTDLFADGALPGMTVEPEVPDDLFRAAVHYADTAIVSICRYSGEDWDRRTQSDSDLSDDILPYGQAFLKESARIFQHGDFYLSDQESALVSRVRKSFAHVIIVLNVGGMVDSSWFVDDPGYSAVLLALQGGMEGGAAIADVLCGRVNPSGHLTDTYAKSLDDYPSTAGFHESTAYVNYTDDIYVGYRYFETVPGAGERVNYPFGYGLSYTQFHTDVLECGSDLSNIQDAMNQSGDVTATAVAGDVIHVSLEVTNIGNFPGKDVLQLYYETPSDRIDGPARVLGAFQKTRELKSGESQQIVLSIPVSQMSVYDERGVYAEAAYVLEPGTYRIYVGENVREAAMVQEYQIGGNFIVVKQLSHHLVPSKLPKRLHSDGTYEKLQVSDYAQDPDVLERMTPEEQEGRQPEVRAEDSYIQVFWNQKDHHDLIEVARGEVSLDEFMKQLTTDDLIWLVEGHRGTGLANTGSFGGIKRLGVPYINTADGPAGLRIQPECEVYTTAFPCATLLASTWNPDLVRQVGMAGAREVKENNMGVWLTPAINIHRSPLCGRNFEYYSEDPYLAGMTGAAMVQGIQSQNVGVSVKHFAANNKETNRKDSDSRVSERALREIYLRAFQIIVELAEPWTFMSSYNIINGVRCSENHELLTDILRDEWGFRGLVMSDWWNHSEQYLELKAGNDMKMMNGYPDRVREALDRGVLTEEDLRRSARRVLELILKID